MWSERLVLTRVDGHTAGSTLEALGQFASKVPRFSANTCTGCARPTNLGQCQRCCP